jgi:hypothetical protein
MLWWRLWKGLVESAFGGSHEYGVRRLILFWLFWQESGFSRSKDVFTFSEISGSHGGENDTQGHTHRVVWLKKTDVSEEHTASIIKT